MVVHNINPSIWEAEAGEVLGQLGLHRKALFQNKIKKKKKREESSFSPSGLAFYRIHPLWLKTNPTSDPGFMCPICRRYPPTPHHHTHFLAVTSLSLFAESILEWMKWCCTKSLDLSAFSTSLLCSWRLQTWNLLWLVIPCTELCGFLSRK
jgi:hypothetical protein